MDARVLFFVCVFFSPFVVLSQGKVSESFRGKKATYDYLLNSPTTIKCDTLGMGRIVISAYKNGMPLADNDRIIWNAWIGRGDASSISNHSICRKLKIQKIYLFFEQEVLIYSFLGDLNKEGEKIYAPPLSVVLEYFDTDSREVAHLKTDHFPPYTTVD